MMSGVATRLGTWLPNPHYVRLLRDAPPLYPLRALPRLRAASYFYRELFGINRRDARLLQITDGGHYENLGLVEALRRRCKVIYCFDGSGDPGQYLSTLAEAVRLAEFELGVEITLDHDGDYAADNLTPGSGRQSTPQHAFSSLNTRLTKGVIVRGAIQCPPAAQLGTPEQSRGVLIFARASLWDE